MADGARSSEHYLVIARAPGAGAARAALLLLPGDAGWVLPRLESDERRSADVAPLTREARAALGVEVSVLGCLADEPAKDGAPRQQVYAIETHGRGFRPPAGARWVEREELSGLALARPGQRPLLDAWLRAQQAPRPPEDGRDWVRTGWWDGVMTWVDAELGRRGLGPVTEAEQVRVWEFSHVLRLRAGDVTLYFKALPASGAKEPRLTSRLVAMHPDVVPELIAVDLDRRWLLMRATPGPELTDVGDPLCWEQAATSCARIQLDWLSREDELAAVGCPRVALSWLSAQVAPLLADGVALGGLPAPAAARLRHRGPELERLCAELAEHAVPDSLEHGDLWAANVILGPRGPVLIDWEDALLAHPFFSPSLLLLSLEHTDALAGVPDARSRIREAYLGPWRERGPLRGWPAGRLERAFEVAQEVALLHYAVQFWLGGPRIETSWEVRDFVSFFLERLIEG